MLRVSTVGNEHDWTSVYGGHSEIVHMQTRSGRGSKRVWDFVCQGARGASIERQILGRLKDLSTA